jgi:MYXO-CTERM domain-containing protein
MQRASLFFILLAGSSSALLAGCSSTAGSPGASGESVGTSRSAIGEQQDGGASQEGFPSPWERAVFMAANRARSDPSTVKGTASTVYPAVKPLVLELPLERSSRFHATNLLSADTVLMHDSPCTLNTDVATSGCTGLVSCACATPVPTACAACAKVANPDEGCGTAPFTRIGYWYPAGNAEVAAAGYDDPWSTMAAWVDEAAGADGHRTIIDSVGSDESVAGFGHAGGTGGCYQTFDVGDFGPTTTAPPTIASAAPMPISSNAAGSFTIYATWADPGGAPASLNAVVDETCTPMTLELGTPTLNATYMATVALTAGCHSVFIVGVSASKVQTVYPTTTAFTIPVGSGTCADQVSQPVVTCPGIDGGVGGADAGVSDAGRDAETGSVVGSDGGVGAREGGGDGAGVTGSDGGIATSSDGGSQVGQDGGGPGVGVGGVDGSTANDAGDQGEPGSGSNGCSCRVAMSTGSTGAWAALAAAGLVLPLRRRRRANEKTIA